MDKTTILAIASCSMAMALLISYVQAGSSANLIVFNSLAYFSAFVLIAAIYSKYRQQSESNEILEGLMKGLSRVSYYKSAGLPEINSLGKASSSSSSKKVSRILRETARRMELGENFFDAISDATAKERQISENLHKYIKSGESSIEEALIIYESKKKSGISQSNSLMSRYATCSMFVSTVAPSFVIFSFIGSMLISQSSSSMEFMSISLIAAIPVVYSIINSASNGRFIG